MGNTKVKKVACGKEGGEKRKVDNKERKGGWRWTGKKTSVTIKKKGNEREFFEI